MPAEKVGRYKTEVEEMMLRFRVGDLDLPEGRNRGENDGYPRR